jgi:hypothetical protein
MLLTYTDVLVLRHFRPPEEVAHYYAAAKILALVTFIHFSVSAAVSHRFRRPPRRRRQHGARSTRRQHRALDVLAVARDDCGDAGLRQTHPLAVRAGFEAGYPLMFILAVALVARAAVGPAERVLNMLGEQRRCALVYAAVLP